MNTMTAVGTFTDRSDAVAAVRELRDVGFAESQIGLISKREEAGASTSDRSERTGLADDPTHTRWEEGAGIGAAAGALTGTGLGLAVAAGLIPPLGPVIAGGTLLALLASAGGGAAVGTVVGGLIGLGIPEEEAASYEEEVTSGRTLVAVSAGPRYVEAVDILRRHNGTVRSQEAGSTNRPM
jgi:hypothetical protein